MDLDRPSEFDLALATTPAPSFDTPEAAQSAGAAEAALDVVRQCLHLVIEQGHVDGARTRAVALACLVGLYATPGEAAKKSKLCRSTVLRAIEAMRQEMRLRNTPRL